MKKTILIIVSLLISTFVSGYVKYEVEQPNYEFRSTSQLLPDKQNTVVFPVGEASSNYRMRRARGIDDGGEGPGYKPTDPATPVGNSVIPLLFITFVYLFFKVIKKGA